MPDRLSVYIPDELHRALQAYREHLNVSRICQEALAREVARLSNVFAVDGPLPQLDEDQRTSIAARLRQERERRQTFWYSLGYRTAFDWACNRADADVLETVAAGEILDAVPVPGWVEGMQAAPPPLPTAARAWGEMHETAREATRTQPDAPAEDVVAFNRGMRDAAKAVWDAVASDVIGDTPPDRTGAAAPE